MENDYKTVPLVKNEAKKRFEIEVGGHLAFTNYGEFSNQIALVHTETEDQLKGKVPVALW